MKVRPVSVVCLILLFFFAFISAADAVPFSKYEYRMAYDDFVKQIIGDLRRAGFQLDVGVSKEITDGSARGVYAEILIKKYPDSLKKYFGEPGPHSFLLQLVELEQSIVFSVKTRKEGKSYERLSFFGHVGKRDIYYFDMEGLARNAKAELTLALYDLDCQSRYSGSTKKDEKENPLFWQVRNFPYGVDEFITLFFKELKSYGLKYTVVERPPDVEIRIFVFPPELSLLLPEPNNAFFLLENKSSPGFKEKIFISRTDRFYRNNKNVDVITFDGSIPLEKRASMAAQNVFLSLYVPYCPFYGDVP